jgi:hypothetical protein
MTNFDAETLSALRGADEVAIRSSIDYPGHIATIWCMMVCAAQ